MHNLRNKSNLLERMDHDSQKILFEMIAKKMIVSRTMYRDRLRSIKKSTTATFDNNFVRFV